MRQRFSTNLLTDDWDYLVDDDGIIIKYQGDDTYTMDELFNIVSRAHKIERWTFGWEVQWEDEEGKKKVFLRGNGPQKINWSTSSRQSIHAWIQALYMEVENEN